MTAATVKVALSGARHVDGGGNPALYQYGDVLTLAHVVWLGNGQLSQLRELETEPLQTIVPSTAMRNFPVPNAAGACPTPRPMLSSCGVPQTVSPGALRSQPELPPREMTPTRLTVVAELESALISERVTAGMGAARARGRRLGRPPMPLALVREIETLARTTTLSVRAIHRRIDGRASRGRVGEITKQVRSAPAASSTASAFSCRNAVMARSSGWSA